MNQILHYDWLFKRASLNKFVSCALGIDCCKPLIKLRTSRNIPEHRIIIIIILKICKKKQKHSKTRKMLMTATSEGSQLSHVIKLMRTVPYSKTSFFMENQNGVVRTL